MPYPAFDRSRLRLRPLAERVSDMSLADLVPLDAPAPEPEPEGIDWLARRIRHARARGAAVILAMGAHVIKQGMSRHVLYLMEHGWITHLALNGAGAIHDYELARHGATTESVARYIREGQFGLWQETGEINDAAVEGAREGMGLGEAIGRRILREGLPHADVSLLAAGVRLGLPVTVHVSIGQDIVHEHPNCDGAAIGATSYRDFLVFAHSVSQLEGGVFCNAGSAVMGPEVYLKALAMARNVAHQEGRVIRHFSTAVFDLVPLPEGELGHEAPKSDPFYYYRPWKTILVRTVQDGGESRYICADHRVTFSHLVRRLREGP